MPQKASNCAAFIRHESPTLERQVPKLSFLKLAALVTLAIACVGNVKAAVNDSGSWGRNRLNQTVLVYINEVITFKNDPKGRRTDEVISTVSLDGECNWVGQSDTTNAYALDCRHGTTSVLAGAYFKFRFSKTHRNKCGRGSTIYECAIGCTAHRVPKVIVEEPYEC